MLYLIPIEEISHHTSEVRLRIEVAKNNQACRVRLAEAYEYTGR